MTDVTLNLAVANELADDLRAYVRVLSDASWALDSGLSAIRKAAAGYRNPDPDTGREQEHFGIPTHELAGRILHAARLVRALDTLPDIRDAASRIAPVHTPAK